MLRTRAFQRGTCLARAAQLAAAQCMVEERQGSHASISSEARCLGVGSEGSRCVMQTLDFFQSGRYLAKMQSQGDNLISAELLGYQEPSQQPQLHGDPGQQQTTPSLHMCDLNMHVTFRMTVERMQMHESDILMPASQTYCQQKDWQSVVPVRDTRPLLLWDPGGTTAEFKLDSKNYLDCTV